jgi:hypothetical protein
MVDLNYDPVMKLNFMHNIILKVANHAQINYVESSKFIDSKYEKSLVLFFSNLQRPERLITKLKSINFDENTRQKLVIVRQPRNADEKSKGFTNIRIESAPGVLIKTPN